jgi:hypothetical protein
VQIFTYGAAGALFTVDKNAIGTLRLRGVITPAIVAQAHADVAAYVERRSVQALATDALNASCEASVFWREPELVPEVLRLIPCALVMQPQHADGLYRHMVRCARAGLLRRGFTQFDPAHRWATEKGLALQTFPPELPCFLETQ